MSLIYPSANVLTRVLSPRVYPILWKSSIIGISFPFYDLHNAALARYPASAAFMACLASSLLPQASVTTILDSNSKPCIPGIKLDRVADGHLSCNTPCFRLIDLRSLDISTTQGSAELFKRGTKDSVNNAGSWPWRLSSLTIRPTFNPMKPAQCYFSHMVNRLAFQFTNTTGTFAIAELSRRINL